MRTLPDELLRATAKGEKASKQVRAAARMFSVDFDAAAAAELGCEQRVVRFASPRAATGWVWQVERVDVASSPDHQPE